VGVVPLEAPALPEAAGLRPPGVFGVFTEAGFDQWVEALGGDHLAKVVKVGIG